MPVLLKEPMNQLHFVFCLLKQLCFLSYTMIMCVVFCMVSINKSIMLTQKLFIATFSKKEQIITILLYWSAVISVNFYCKLFRQDSRKDILLNHVSFFFFFHCIIVIVRWNCPKKTRMKCFCSGRWGKSSVGHAEFPCKRQAGLSLIWKVSFCMERGLWGAEFLHVSNSALMLMFLSITATDLYCS